MTKPPSLLLAAGAVAALSACAVTPYDSDFSCKSDDYGQCIHPEGAYAVALANTVGNARPVDVNPDLDATEPVNRRQRKRRDRSRRRAIQAQPLGPATPYEGYQEAMYREVTGLVEQPVTPMLTKPKVVRTLIMPYAGKGSDDVLYMPRYIYTIIEGPRFVMGDYLNTAQPDDLASQIAGGTFGKPREDTDPPAAAPLDRPAPNQQPTRLRDKPGRTVDAGEGGDDLDPVASLRQDLTLGARP